MKTPIAKRLAPKGSEIRPMRESDVHSVLEMVRALASFHNEDTTLTHDALMRDALCPAPWIRILVAENRDGLVGYAATFRKVQLSWGQRDLVLHHLYVASGSRAHGIGAGLVWAVLRDAQLAQCGALHVGTHPDNAAARGFYTAFGFSPHKHDPCRFVLEL